LKLVGQQATSVRFCIILCWLLAVGCWLLAVDDDLEELLDIFSDLEWLAKGYRMIIFIVTVLGLLQFLRYISFSARFGMC
jgi:hypothetical protein